jgi:putative flippase GtrA/SAM-dependent methyltransferase
VNRVVQKDETRGHRFSRAVRHLRSPDSGLLGRGGRFVIAGGIVALIYVTVTTLLANVFGIGFQWALAIGYATAIAAHFLLQRFFVWIHHEEFALPVREQVGRYLLVAGAQYSMAALVTATVPSALDVSVTVVFLVWTIAISAIGFLIFGRGVFHAKSPVEPDVTRSAHVPGGMTFDGAPVPGYAAGVPPRPATDSAVGRDDWDSHWSEYADSAARNPAQEYRRRLILRMLSLSGPPTHLLDIGSGSGELAADVRAAFPESEIVGVELSAKGIELARRRVPGAEFLQRDLLEPGEPPPRLRGWATHAVCSEVFEHIEQPAALLNGALPYLAPGCWIVVTVPGGPMSAFDRHIGHRAHYTPQELAAVLEGAGLEIEQKAGAGFPFFNLYRLLVVVRGERLVGDVAGGGGSALARLAMRFFGLLFRLNLSASPWGWQTVVLARVPHRAA